MYTFSISETILANEKDRLTGFLPFSSKLLTFAPFQDNRVSPRYGCAPRGTFSTSGMLSVLAREVLLNDVVLARQLIDGLVRREVAERLGADDVLASSWLRDARRRAFIRSVSDE